MVFALDQIFPSIFSDGLDLGLRVRAAEVVLRAVGLAAFSVLAVLVLFLAALTGSSPSFLAGFFRGAGTLKYRVDSGGRVRVDMLLKAVHGTLLAAHRTVGNARSAVLHIVGVEHFFIAARIGTPIE